MKDVRGEDERPVKIRSSADKKNKMIAFLLAMFFGAIGLHKFYLGKKGTGLLYLLFFWTCIPALIAFFEAIGFLIMSEEDFDAKYNQL